LLHPHKGQKNLNAIIYTDYLFFQGADDNLFVRVL